MFIYELANQVVSTRMNASIKSKNEAAMVAKGKRVSQSKAKRFSSALKNVFKSDTKDDRLKVEYPFIKQPSTENLKFAPESNVSMMSLQDVLLFKYS